MTMLDRMRRRIGWLKWILALVILAFIVFYVPDFLRQTDAAGPGEVIARVGDQSITVGEFRRAYQAQLAAYQRAYGGSMSEQLLRQMGIDQQILQQMVDERAAVHEARRLGLTVTDAELASRIYAMPAFQRDGRFAGQQVYEQVLRSARPPLTPAQFEESLRRALLVEKLRSALTDWITVSDAEVDQEYRRRNEKVKLELVMLSADSLRDKVALDEKELAAYFEKNKEKYRIPEQRKIKYLLVDVDAIKSRIVVPTADAERAYRQNIDQYTTPEQVRASHILLKTEGKDAAAVRTQAESLLKQARAGADFAALARKHSEDEGSAQQGGDLDYFGRGRMVKEFEDAAFELEPGQISDIVETQFGLHIIKVVDKKPAVVTPFEDVKAQIAEQLAFERAQAEASTMAAALEAEIDDAGDLERVAKARGLTVQESDFFGRDDPVKGLGVAPEVAERAFELGQDEVAGPIRVARGHVFFTTIGKQESRLPELKAVQDRVRDDAVAERAAELARARAKELLEPLRKDFARAAKSAGLEVKTTELLPRGSAWPDIGMSPALDAAVFELPVGGVTEPITAPGGVVIARVADKQEVVQAALEAARETLREELIEAHRGRFFAAYMQKAKERIAPSVDQEILRRATIVG
ncbi:MAG TPA: peptidyl-prolyl cis-trans isomerase [Vicinamibacterales bacterium]|nr:peptidyl-prolyl cis-trans isomerase [Vicinamibacterales bacterium]